jgi:hypothetical protein
MTHGSVGCPGDCCDGKDHIRRCGPVTKEVATDGIWYYLSAELYNCLAGETEIITADGVRRIGDVAGTTQRLLTRHGKWVDAPVKSFGEQQLQKIVLQRNGKTKDIFATAGHRWFVRDGHGTIEEVVTQDLKSGMKLQYVHGHGVKDVTPSPFGVAHGFCYGDGSSVKGERNSDALVLCGDKDYALAKYFALCPSSVTEQGPRFSAIPKFFKQKPSLRETKSYLYGWLAGYFAADGSCNIRGEVVIGSSVLENITFVRDVCAVLGIAHYGIKCGSQVSNLTDKDHTMWYLTLSKATLHEDFFIGDEHRKNFIEHKDAPIYSWVVSQVEPTDRVEEVYCAVVDEEQAFALDENILTGNCNESYDANGGLVAMDPDSGEIFGGNYVTVRRCRGIVGGGPHSKSTVQVPAINRVRTINVYTRCRKDQTKSGGWKTDGVDRDLVVMTLGAKDQPPTAEDDHYECQSGACVKVPGSGQNECDPLASKNPCVGTPTHLACENGTCTSVSGFGEDACDVEGMCCKPAAGCGAGESWDQDACSCVAAGTPPVGTTCPEGTALNPADGLCYPIVVEDGDDEGNFWEQHKTKILIGGAVVLAGVGIVMAMKPPGKGRR